jgi:hypothetical protein
MNGCLAILAHEKAAPTIADFYPQWRKLGLPMIAFLPVGDSWPGGPVNRVVNYGVSAHRGLPVYDRFMQCLQTMLQTDYEWFALMEYDTANLTDTLPGINVMCVNAGLMQAFGAGAEDGQILALSPWIMTRPMAAALLEAMRTQLRKNDCAQWVDGLLDRFIGVAILKENVPYAGLEQCWPWCEDRWDMMKLIADKNATIIHGWKSKESFKHLWPKQ